MKCRNKIFAVAAGAIVCSFMVVTALHLSATFNLYSLTLPIYLPETSADPTVFNYSSLKSDAYQLSGDVRIPGGSAAIFVASSWIDSVRVRPYARKYDSAAMAEVKAFEIKAAPVDNLPGCDQTLAAPAVLFSAGGYVENFFHVTVDILIPLFATAHRFNRDVVFLVTDLHTPFVEEYGAILQSLSKYETIDIDRANRTLCFTKLIAGIKAHRSDFSIDPSPLSTFSSRNFTKLLRTVYSLNRGTVQHDHRRRLRLLLASRNETRRLTNEAEVLDLARSLGFDTAVETLGGNLTAVAGLVNTFDVLVGVHGAGLTNMIFLPENAVVVQITPVGLDVFARICYGTAEPEMKLKYLEYKVRLNESSLIGKFPAESEVYKDPDGLWERKGFEVGKNIYLDNQDVNLDLTRFRNTLLKALELLTS